MATPAIYDSTKINPPTTLADAVIGKEVIAPMVIVVAINPTATEVATSNPVPAQNLVLI